MPPDPHLHHSGVKLGTGTSRLMLVSGRLAVDAAGCVYSAESGGVGILWPDDYSIRVDAEGTVEIVGSDGHTVLREGERFQAGGGFGDGQLPGDCALRHPEYVVIGTAVHKLEPT